MTLRRVGYYFLTLFSARRARIQILHLHLDFLRCKEFDKLRMVFYFISNVVSPPFTIFMGAEKHENEDLIKWGWPEDVWFHVDKVSSAHVYLRLQPVSYSNIGEYTLIVDGFIFQGQTIEDVPYAVIEDAAQLVKANSISGNKMNNVDVVYTMWENLKKTPSMDVGQVSFHREKDVMKIRVEKRINEVVNRLNKTKTEAHPDFRAEREKR